MLRKLIAIIIIIVVVLGFALGGVVLYIDTIARHAVERGATTALGVTTTLDSADVGILSGEFSMQGLNVANPDGYQSPQFLDMNSGAVQVSLGTLREETVLLPHLTLDGLDLNLEKRGGKANYDAILDNLKKTEETDEPAPDESGKRFVIEKVTITDIMVHIDLLPEGGALTRTELPIERIELTNVGSESEKGALLSDLSGVLIKAILTAVVNKAGDLPGLALDGLEQGLGQLSSIGEIGVQFTGESLTQITGGIGDLGENISGEAGKALEDAGKQIQKGIGGLLGGNKNDQNNNVDDDDDDNTQSDDGQP